MTLDAAADPVHGDEFERWAMARAIVLADGATSTARPNPGVGCLVLQGGKVVAEGVTSLVGGPHAEIVALTAAGDRARGATVVTTLEPCNHQGRTGPCSVALVEAGVARVVYAVTDHGHSSAGGGDRLQSAGIEVEEGLLEPWAREVHRAFLIRTATGRPAVTLKVAQTADGAMAMAARRWVTGPEARSRVHRLRALVDGVLVGVGTVLADDPGLDVRDARLDAVQPRPVVVDAGLRTPAGARVVARGAMILAVTGADPSARRALEAAGAEVHEVPAVARGRVDLAAAMKLLANTGMTHVLAEPGPRLGAALLGEGLVDDVILHVARDVADGPDLPTVAPALAHPLALGIRHLRMLGDDLEIHLRPAQ